MNTKPVLILCVVCMAFLASCKKEDILQPEEIIPAGATVTASAIIYVSDINGNPLSNAAVHWHSNTGITNAEGVVVFNEKPVKEVRTVIRVEKIGFLSRTQIVPVTSGSRNVYSLQLPPFVSTASFQAATGASVATPLGGSVVFGAQSIADENGNPYTGTVQVAAAYFSGIADDLKQTGPNNFLGKDAAGNIKFLENMGMIRIELTDGSNAKLNIRPGATAEVHIPIAPQYQATAPASAPLYAFDEEAGAWKEEGKAIKVGQEYVGTVSHFSFWMCPSVYNHYTISAQLECVTSPLPYTEVSVMNLWGAYLGSVWTSPAGAFSGQIPETLTFTLRAANTCDEEVFSTPIGPFTSNTNLGTFNVCTGGVNYGRVQGNAVDCSGNPDPQALCRVQTGGLFRWLPNNLSGAFDSYILFCNGEASASVTCINPGTQQYSSDFVLAISNAMNFGTASVCNTVVEFAQFTLDGNTYLYNENSVADFAAAISIAQNRTELRVSGGQNFNLTKFGLNIPGLTSSPGTYSLGGSPFSYSFETTGPNSTSFIQAQITAFSNSPGGIIEGMVPDTSYVDGSGTPHTLTNTSFRFILDTIQ